MKRMTAFLLVLVLLPLWGCAQQQTAPLLRSAFDYYYKTAEVGHESDDGVIRAESREIAGHEGDLSWILTDYFSGPRSEDLVSPFPRDTELVSCEVDGGTAIIQLNKEFANLDGIELSVAASCIAATCFGAEGVEAVSISVPSGLLDGKLSINLSRDGLILRDASADMMNTELTLYFADQSRRYLIGEEITVSMAEMDNPQDYLMQKLLEGPKDRELASVLPEGTEILKVAVEDGVCNVNLSRSFTANLSEDPWAQYLALASIANTVTQFDDASQVEFYVESTLLTQYGVWRLDEPLTADENAVGPVHTGLNEFDVDLYLPLAGQEQLGRIPARVRQTASETAMELVAMALISYPGVNCVENPFPGGTELLSMQESGEDYIVDLSGELLGAEDLTACVRAMVLTLCAMGQAETVRLTVDGGTPVGDYGDLFEAHSYQEAWVLY